MATTSRGTKRKRTVGEMVPTSLAEGAHATGTFLDTLPLGSTDDEAAPESRAPVAGARLRDATEMVNLLVRLTTIQPLRSQNLAGNAASAPRTDTLEMADAERFYMAGRKVRGPVRSLVSEYMRGEKCSDAETRHKKVQCGTCFVCRLFGHFAQGATSRIDFSDFWSVQDAKPIVFGSVSTHSGNPFMRLRDMVPPGVHFWGVIRIRKPTLNDIATLKAALDLTAGNGFGAETTHFGTCRVEIAAAAGGYLTSVQSAEPMLRIAAEGKTAGEIAAEALATLPYRPEAIFGDEAEAALERVSRLSPLSPCFGEDF